MRKPQDDGSGIPGLPVASLELLRSAVTEIPEAVVESVPERKYLRGHLVALRAAAAVLAARARPMRSVGPRNVWSVLPGVAPELTEWAEFFAAGSRKRAVIENGATRVITVREADDLVRDAHNFLQVVVNLLERGPAPAPRNAAAVRDVVAGPGDSGVGQALGQIYAG